MKKMGQLKNIKGLTLVEVVVAMAIMAIIGLAMMIVFQVASSSVQKTKSVNEQQMIVDSVVDVISNELRYATDVTLCDATTSTGSGLQSVYVEDSKIYMTNIDPSSEVFTLMLNHEMELAFEYKTPYNIGLKVSVTGKYGTTTLDTTVKLINCELNADDIERTSDTQSVFHAVWYQP